MRERIRAAAEVRAVDHVIEPDHEAIVSGRVRWSVLGRVRVMVDGAEVALAPQARAVLAHLLRRPGQPVPIEQLRREGGAGDDDEKAIAAARVAVSRLRGALAGVTSISATPQGYVIDVDPQAVDHVAFEKAVRDARASEWPATSKHLVERALDLWADPPFGEWSGHEAFALDVHSLEELHRSAVDLWCTLVTQTGLHADELDRLERAALAEPLREQRWVALMLAHYRSGNQTEATRTYERAREILADEVGLEPGAELRTMLRRVLEQDARLDWRPERLPTQPSSLASLDTATVVIGRESDIVDVVSLLDRHRVVTLVGLGGIGKSALAGEVARSVGRTAWITPLADVHDRSGVLRAIAASMGLSGRRAESGLLAAVTEHLESVAGLLVLDNCEHLEREITDVIVELIAGAPDARVLATSRVELVLRGGVGHHLGPLATGTPDEPGPAALIVADHASIGRSAMTARWPEIESLCARAEGIPLALQLLGSSSTATGAADALDAVSHAVRTAVDALPAESRTLVRTLAALPAGTRTEFLAEVTGRSEADVRRSLGFAVRGSLVVQRAGADSAMVRIIEPARDVLRAAGADDRLIDSIGRALLRLAAAARPSLIDRMDVHLGTLLDDEHDTVAWVLPKLTDDERLVLACALAPIWRSAGRTAFGAAVLEQLESVARRSDPLLAARFWVARSQIAPSPANRVPFLAELEQAVKICAAEGVEDVELRARGELALALGWTGRFDEALEQCRLLRERCPAGNDWAELSVDSLLALGQAIIGDPLGAADAMFDISQRHRAAGDVDEWLWAAASSAAFAREAGDLGRARRSLASAGPHEPDRFTRFSHALLSYERAQLAALEGQADAGPRLFEALGELTENAEARHVAACRRDLGSWRLSRGDRGGVADLAAASLVLCVDDPRQAVVGLRQLAEALGEQGSVKDAALITAAADHLAERSAIEEALLSAEGAALLARATSVLTELASTGRTAARR